MWVHIKKGTPRENYAPDDPRVLQAQEMRRSGMSYHDIAVAIGLYPVAVQRFCNCPKYTKPKRPGQPKPSAKMTITRNNAVSVGRLTFWSRDDAPLHLISSSSFETADGTTEYTVTVRTIKGSA